MKFRNILLRSLAGLAAATSFSASAAGHYVGGDVSLLPEYEKAGAIYKTHSGEPIQDLLIYSRDLGMNAMRVRLMVNPEDYTGSDKDPNACQTLDYILPLCQRIKEDGLGLILDFMYSDTWADPGKQWTPKAWANLTDEELYQKIYEYTRETLETLKAAGAAPDFIQTGNEISYGMLWGPEGTPEDDCKKVLMNNPKNWMRFGKLLENAGKACREVCPDAKIIIHTERVQQPDVMKYFFDMLNRMKLDYDIIGVSYYPYFHGSLSVLDTALTTLETTYPEKDLMVMETGYPYKYEIPGTTEKVDYPYSDAGQNQYCKDLVDMLERHPRVDGLFWWWMEYNAYGTKLTGWYNAPLFDSHTGRACSALETLCSFAKDSGVTRVQDFEEENTEWYDLTGRPAGTNPTQPGLYLSTSGKKIIR